LRQGLFTLPFLYYIEMENNDPDINKLINGDCPFEDKSVQEIVARIAKSKAIDKSFAEAKQFCERADQCLRQLPESPERSELNLITSYTVERTF